MSKLHKAHEVIWLQVDPDGESYDPEQWGLEYDATWCEDQINSNDVKYILADKVEELEAKVIAQQARIEQLVGVLEFVRRSHVLNSVSCWNEFQRQSDVALSTPDDLSALRAHDEKLIAANTQAAKEVLAEIERLDRATANYPHGSLGEDVGAEGEEA